MDKHWMTKKEAEAAIKELQTALDKLPENAQISGLMKMGVCPATILLHSRVDALDLYPTRTWSHYGRTRGVAFLDGVEITGPVGQIGGDSNA